MDYLTIYCIISYILISPAILVMDYANNDTIERDLEERVAAVMLYVTAPLTFPIIICVCIPFCICENFKIVRK
jgi:hypothetical protein